MAFKEISIKELNVNPVTMFSDGWAILTAGSEDSFNGMTVSWGATGELWGKAVAFAFVRPQRYTHEFCEKSEYFTLSFFAGKNREELTFFGRNSGRDCDKFAETGITAKADGDYVIDLTVPQGLKAVLYVPDGAVVNINSEVCFQNGDYVSADKNADIEIICKDIA